MGLGRGLLLLSLLWSSAALALTDKDKDALTLLVLGDKPNDVQECAVSALSVNLGMVYMQKARASDEVVRNSLMGDLPDSPLRTFREQQFARWQQGHDPWALAQMSFDYCMTISSVKFDLGELGKTCFGLASLGAWMETQKSGGKSVEEAVALAQRMINGQLPEKYVRQIVERVYQSDYQRDNYLAHRRTFIECVRNAQ